MPLFRRRRDPARDVGQPGPDAPGPHTPGPAAQPAPPAADGTGPDGTGPDDSATTADTATTPEAAATGETGAADSLPPPEGPVDVGELNEQDRAARLDLGALLLSPHAAMDSLEVQLQADEASGEVLAVLVLDGEDAAVELRAFAAPRKARIWDDIRTEIAEGARGAGGQTGEVIGPWGIELLVQVPVQLPDGQPAVQASRIVGIDGPRWFLRATFLGRAAIAPETAGRLRAVVEQLAVNRGSGPMAPRDPIPLVVPGQAPGDPLPVPEGHEPLAPFERGPEITEIR